MKALLLLLLWWILAEGHWDSWVVGLPAVAAAQWVGRRLLPAAPQADGSRLSPLGVAGFVLEFFLSSFIGGLDITRRSLHPRLLQGASINPGLLEFPLRAPPGPARTLFAGALNLVPGTVSVEPRGDILLLHVIDLAPATERNLRRLERRVAGVFGHVLEAAP